MKTLKLFSLLLLALGLNSAALADSTAPLTCTIQTYNGRYLTAVGGGGRITDVIHSDATRASTWETFRLIDSNSGTPNVRYGIQTSRGYYLTAVNGGGRITDVIHSDATAIRDWEKFEFISIGGGWYSIKTIRGNYLTAVGGGGRITDVLHTDATRVGNWEKFYVNCRSGLE
jgi:hypothetical protein